MAAKQMTLIAHRVASHDAPENTLAAFKYSLDLGANGFELEAQVTMDAGHRASWT